MGKLERAVEMAKKYDDLFRGPILTRNDDNYLVRPDWFLKNFDDYEIKNDFSVPDEHLLETNYKGITFRTILSHKELRDYIKRGVESGRRIEEESPEPAKNDGKAETEERRFAVGD